MSRSYDDSAVFNALTVGEATELIAATETDRDHLLFRLLWTTGAQVSEVLQLRPVDVLSEDSLRMVNEKQEKHPPGYDGPRTVHHKTCFVPEDVVSELKHYCAANAIRGAEYVFRSARAQKGYLSRQQAWRVLKKLARRVGVQKAKSGQLLTPAWLHLFRHGWAVNGLRQGLNLRTIGDQLGHASFESTRVYARVADEDRRAAVKKLKFA